MSARFARDEEITTWREDGWVLLDGLIGTAEIDAATVDLREVFPHPRAVPRGSRRRDREVARPATGVRGTLLTYRPDEFHRAVDLTAPGGARFLLNVSFKPAGQDWI